MSYTVISNAALQPTGTVVPNALDALRLARELARETNDEPTIAAENGWVLTLEELEELAKS